MIDASKYCPTTISQDKARRDIVVWFEYLDGCGGESIFETGHFDMP